MLIHRNIGNKSRQNRRPRIAKWVSVFYHEERKYQKDAKFRAIARDEKRNGRKLLAIEMDRDGFIHPFHGDDAEDIECMMQYAEDYVYFSSAIDCRISETIDDPINEGDDFNICDQSFYEDDIYTVVADPYYEEDVFQMIHNEPIYTNPVYERAAALSAMCDTVKNALFVAQDDPRHELLPLEKFLVAQNTRQFVYKHAGQTQFMAYDNAAGNRMAYLDGRYRIICAACAEEELRRSVNALQIALARWVANGCVTEISPSYHPAIQSVVVLRGEDYTCEGCCVEI